MGDVVRSVRAQRAGIVLAVGIALGGVVALTAPLPASAQGAAARSRTSSSASMALVYFRTIEPLRPGNPWFWIMTGS